MDNGRKPFEPIDGVTPRWQKLYRLVIERKVGDEITYHEAAEALGFDRLTERTRKIVQETMRETLHHLERNGEHVVGTRARFGWVILDPSRELEQVDRRRTKSYRALGRTLRGAGALNTRRDKLSQTERDRLDAITRTSHLAARVVGRRGMNMNELRKAIESGTSPA